MCLSRHGGKLDPPERVDFEINPVRGGIMRMIGRITFYYTAMSHNVVVPNFPVFATGQWYIVSLKVF